MKKLLLLSILFNLSLSCDTVTEKDLYTRFDPEHMLAMQLQLRRCVEDSAFLARATNYTDDFDNAPFRVGDTYFIEQDTDDPERVFAQIMAINADNMVIRFNSPNSDLDKEVTFFEAEARELVLSVFNPILCSPMLTNFSGSEQGNGNLASFVWTKNEVITPDDDDDDDDPEEFRNQRDSLNINLNFPLFFYFYNGTKTLVSALPDAAEVTSTSTISVTQIDPTSNATCMGTSQCRFDDGAATFTPCTLAVEPSVMTTQNDSTLSFLSGCELLESND